MRILIQARLLVRPLRVSTIIGPSELELFGRVLGEGFNCKGRANPYAENTGSHGDEF
jgi:hypothetical protein